MPSKRWDSSALYRSIPLFPPRAKKEGSAAFLPPFPLFPVPHSFALKLPMTDWIMEQLIPIFHGNRQEAEQALNSYIQEHPEEAAYLED